MGSFVADIQYQVSRSAKRDVPTKSPTPVPPTFVPTAAPTATPTAAPTKAPTVHPCTDGSHGCHDVSDGGICYSVANDTNNWWTCGCENTHFCSAGCDAPYVGHNCTLITEAPTTAPTEAPTAAPTAAPTPAPTTTPTEAPTPAKPHA